ncbi:MAG: SpoIIE family protein phosphatase [Butyrivibrio sp.]|nr:SpoIIE family protein phosphatase [Butyrivibrio sp.]
MLSRDIRESGNEELNAVVDKALSGAIGFSEISLDGETYCVAYAPMETVHWTQILFVSKSELEKPTETLLSQMDEITERALDQYAEQFRKSIVFTAIIMIFLIANAVVVAFMFSDRLTGPINNMTQKVGEISKDNFVFEMEDSFRTGDEIEVLARTFGELSDRTRGYIKEIMEMTAQQERAATELDLAARIQANMLPREFPLFPDRTEFDLFASMDPAKIVGGDFYDAFLIDDDHLGLVMADVSDKGVPAALFMVVSRTTLKNRALMGGAPAEIISDVNRSLCQGNSENMFVTVWFAIMDLNTGEVTECNAGHEDPVIKRKEGEFEIVRREHGFVLGALSRMDYEEDSFVLDEGDILFLYTDGLPEATDASDEKMGTERMLEALNRHRNNITEDEARGKNV